MSLLKSIFRGFFISKDSNIVRLVSRGDWWAVRGFIRSGGDVNTTDTFGNSPLTVAVNNRDLKMVELLLSSRLEI